MVHRITSAGTGHQGGHRLRQDHLDQPSPLDILDRTCRKAQKTSIPSGKRLHSYGLMAFSWWFNGI